MSKIIAAAIAAAFVGHAQAVTTYTFSVDGTLTHWIDAWECPGSICPPGTPGSLDGPPFVRSPWHAVLSIDAPDGDGVFAEFGITFDGGRLFPYGISPFAPPLVVTVVDGVMSFDGHAVDGPDNYVFSGMAMSYTQPHEQHYGQTLGTAHLTPVPEPSTWALLLAGLGVAGALQRRRA